MTKDHRVAIVFDENASAYLRALADRCCHVWLVESEENTRAAQRYWEHTSPVDDWVSLKVTTFTRSSELPEQVLDMAMELVEDHHGEFAHNPPVTEVLIVGPEPTKAMFGVLREWGFTRIQSTPEGVVCKRQK